jgi:hypothetical protein
MSNNTNRILISCLIIGVVACLCIGTLVAGGLGFLLATRQTPITIPIPERDQRPPASPSLPSEITPTPRAADPSQPTPTQRSGEPSQAEGTASPMPIPAEVASQMDLIESQVASLRELSPQEGVERFLLTPEELREIVTNDFFEDYTSEEALDEVLELAAFGFLEPGYDIYNLYLDLYSEQIAGFYDDDVKSMYVVQGSEFRAPQRLTYSHEFVHALQDQHYNFKEGLNYSDEACEEDSERCFAILSLVEGDASLVETQWFLTYATRQDQIEIIEFYESYSSPVLDSAPDFLGDSLVFPYVYGIEFVQYLYDRGGWPAVDAAYANPPVSSEQIIHPERYPDDQPVTVSLPDLLPLLGSGWREINRNVIGEYYIYLLLAKGSDLNARLDDDEAWQAAEGWGGDEYLVFYNDDREETALALHIVWDTEKDAQEFAESFNRYANARFGAPTTDQGAQLAWSQANSFHLFTIDGNSTTWVYAPEDELTHQILQEISVPAP